MLTMRELKFDLPVNIRSTPRAKLALDRVVAALRASDRLRWKGLRITQEAAFSALLLWLEGVDGTALEDAVAGQLPRLEAIMLDEDPGPMPQDPGPPPPSRFAAGVPGDAEEAKPKRRRKPG